MEYGTSVESPEVAELENTQSEEMTEVADPSEGIADEQYDYTEDTENNEPEEGEEDADEQGKTKADSAFAEQRRRIAELEAQLAEKELAEEQRVANEEREEEKIEQINNAIEFAREQGFTDEEIDDLIAEIQEEQKHEDTIAELEAKNKELQDRLLMFEVEQQAESDLNAIQRIDPNIKDLDDLGEDFMRLRASGIAPERAFFMCRTADERTRPQGAVPAGKLNRAKTEAEYYTSEELDNLPKDEIRANWEKVQRSMDRLSKER